MTDLAPPPPETVAADVSRALREDVGDGDRTAALIPADTLLETRVISREAAVLSGSPWFVETFRQTDSAVRLSWQASDGDLIRRDQELCRLKGPARAILTGERTALNFLQTLSGTATLANTCARRLEGLNTRILDTRKTIPGLRRAQKYAVRCGGCHNHRMGLYDAFLIKENHIAATGSIESAINMARTLNKELVVEVEVENLEELEQALQAGADRILLDNFSPGETRKAVALTAKRAQLEASGGITLNTLRQYAETGVDYISVGSLTKDIHAIDLSMRFD